MSVARCSWLCLSLLLTLFVLSSSHSHAEENPTNNKIDFVRQIKPILAEHCLDCHGPDTQEGGYRLDVSEIAIKGGDSGLAIIPKQSMNSALLHRVTGKNPDEIMPPDGEPLSQEQIKLLADWIDQGAHWPESESATVEIDHWSFKPIQQPTPPQLENNTWIKNEIDHFVAAKLQENNLTPSPKADRHTLLRRVTLDLIGLLPTAEEIENFVNDTSPNAYEKVVDRLLQSPHFGERWGRHWLDMARYADSDGYEKDRPRPNAWRYRDWVINAINQDMPYDQFTREQLAGDLLENATELQKLATAFHRQTLTNTEGGTDQEEFRVEAVFDRVETTGSIWLGLTVGCVRCHSHKYDPLAQREYYQMFAFFNNGDETTMDVSKSEDAKEKYNAALKVHNQKLSDLEQKVIDKKKLLPAEFAQWESSMQEKLAIENASPMKLHEFTSFEIKGPEGYSFAKQEDGSYLLQGDGPESGNYEITATTNTTQIIGFQLEVLPDESLPNKGPGRAGSGNFVLTEFDLNQVLPGKEPQPVEFASVWADHSQAGYDIQNTLDNKLDTGWAIKPHYSKRHYAIYSLKEPLSPTENGLLKFSFAHEFGGNHFLGRFKLTAITGIIPDRSLKDEARAILAVVPDKRSEEQNKNLLDYYARIDERTKPFIEKLDKLKKSPPASPNMTVRVISQRTKEPRKTHFLRRGDFLQPADEVHEGTFAVLHELKARNAGQLDRIDFANWLFAEDNPLTPRVTVNHIWAKLFGTGIVATVGDFGTRGERPSHPQLLDWLATKYRQLGWSRKAFLKTILMSATYRQSSNHRPEYLEIDPINRLLHRQNRLRVEAELVRDISLQTAGLLSAKIGGPSVFPPLPPEIAALSYANNFKWKTSPGEDKYRRGMYTFFKRTAPHPNLINFDCPDSNTTCLTRRTSNTPLQALQSLNNEIFLESSQSMAQRILADGFATDDQSRIANLVQLCTSMPITPVQHDSFLEMVQTARQWYQDHPDEAAKLTGEIKIDNISPTELATWIATCRVAMNMDEYLTRP